MILELKCLWPCLEWLLTVWPVTCQLFHVRGRGAHVSHNNICVLFSCILANACLGVLKTYLSSSAFLHCSDQKKPLNTLFHEVCDPCNIGYDDLVLYLDLVLALYEKSPEGTWV